MPRRAAIARRPLLLFATALLSALWGCASGPAPVDHFYGIDAGAPSAPAARKLEGNLQVDRFRSDALTGERQLLYRESADAAEIRQHPYHRWSDSPPILLQVELVSFLKAAAAADAVMPATARVKPDYVVSGRILDFERVIEPRLRAVVEIEIIATSEASGEVLVNRSYREERPAANATIAASADAFGEAVRAIFERFLADLSGG